MASFATSFDVRIELPATEIILFSKPTKSFLAIPVTPAIFCSSLSNDLTLSNASPKALPIPLITPTTPPAINRDFKDIPTSLNAKP